MNVRFIDTSIIMNLLEIPKMCDEAERIKDEFREAVVNGETLILPISTIIESGNHIAHISDGNIRRDRAEKFKAFLKGIADDTAPWKLYGVELTKKDINYLADRFPESALTLKMGLGDLSIIRFYENFKETVPAIGKIMIWSTDRHLVGYCEDMTIKRRKDR